MHPASHQTVIVLELLLVAYARVLDLALVEAHHDGRPGFLSQGPLADDVDGAELLLGVVQYSGGLVMEDRLERLNKGTQRLGLVVDREVLPYAAHLCSLPEK